jgi:hypothetical protein
MTGDFEKLAYQEAVRGLDKQEGLLEALRTRAGVLLAASFLAASFLGLETFRTPAPQGPVITAVVTFVISIVAGIYMLLSRNELASQVIRADFYTGFYDSRSDMAEIYRQLAHDADRMWDSNEQEIRRLSRIFTLSVVLFAIEIVSRVVFMGCAWLASYQPDA